VPSSIPSAAIDDPVLSSVVDHHEVYENGKFACRSGRPCEYPILDVPGALLAQQPFAHIPITFDPGDQFGPLASRLFLIMNICLRLLSLLATAPFAIFLWHARKVILD
jgi:hypothetical protein